MGGHGCIGGSLLPEGSGGFDCPGGRPGNCGGLGGSPAQGGRTFPPFLNSGNLLWSLGILRPSLDPGGSMLGGIPGGKPGGIPDEPGGPPGDVLESIVGGILLGGPGGRVGGPPGGVPGGIAGIPLGGPVGIPPGER